MKNDYQSPDFKKLLDKLQQESWQLELIISGFAIYGLFLGIEPLEVEALKAIKSDETLGTQILGTLLTSIYILIMLLLTHVVLRGIWIGAIGLRYVSGDIDYDNLNYTEKFTAFLRKKVGSFDHYISRLENICSTLFALAFLMVFYFISYFMVIGIFTMFMGLLEDLESISETLSKVLTIIFATVYIICALAYAVDFIGGGILKMNKLTSKIFFPVYRVFGFITLSFLYRPLVYNFLDQKKARWVAIMIFPVYFIASIALSSFGRLRSNYLIVNQNTSSLYTNEENYEDELIEDTDLVRFVSIPSKVIEKPYLPVFIGFNAWMEDAVFEHDSTLVPKRDKRGYGFRMDRLMASIRQGGGSIRVDKKSRAMDLQRRYLKKFDELYLLQIDSIVQNNSFSMTTNKKGRFGFETYLDIESLAKGKHLLRFVGPQKKFGGEFKVDTLITIPFWYFPVNSSKTTEKPLVLSDSLTNK